MWHSTHEEVRGQLGGILWSVFLFTSMWLVGINKIFRVGVASSLFVEPYHRLRKYFFLCVHVFWRSTLVRGQLLGARFLLPSGN